MKDAQGHDWQVSETGHPFLTGWRCQNCPATAITQDGRVPADSPSSPKPCTVEKPPVVKPPSPWKSSDPRVELLDQKRAALVLLRPGANGEAQWEAGTGFVEMHQGWSILTSFGDRPVIHEDWPEGWLWVIAP